MNTPPEEPNQPPSPHDHPAPIPQPRALQGSSSPAFVHAQHAPPTASGFSDTSDGGDASTTGGSSRMGAGMLVLLAWVVSLLVAGVMFWSANFAPIEEVDEAQAEHIANAMLEMQGKFLVGASGVFTSGPNDAELMAGQLEPLNIGTVGQRQRYIMLLGELVGPHAAREAVEELDGLIAKRRAQPTDDGSFITEQQQQAQQVLARLYAADGDGPADVVANVKALSDADRSLFEDHYGWIGQLALTPEGSDAAARDRVIGPVQTAVLLVLGVIGLVLVGGIAGFAGLITLFVCALLGKLRSGLDACRAPWGIYVETFAAWIAMFVGFQFACGMIGTAAGLGTEGALALSVVAFFLSLIALAWPCLRGQRWADVRQDIGWTLGRNPLAEPFLGVAGYFIGLPILAVGIAVMIALMVMAGMLAAPAEGAKALDPVHGPAHPIIAQVGSASLLVKLLILCIASVAAPIVEETMFRGVLYRHLRELSRPVGIVVSIGASTLVNSFLFAAIHPQGWFAIPALMGLAIAFTLMREWRGTVIPSMVMHGVSNGILMVTMFILLSS